LKCDLAMIDKRRTGPNEAKAMNVVGAVKDKDVVIFDDMIDTAGTLVEAVVALKKFGAKRIWACATHGVLSNPACDRIVACEELEGLIVTDTIPLSKELTQIPKITVLSVSELLAKAIHRTYNHDSVSSLFV
jgi:ribose-phosphate pyrophosphokinase